MNFASVVDCATISCFLDDHENIVDPRLKQNPEVLFMSSMNPPQSLSEKPCNLNSWHFKNLTPKLHVLLMYLRILLIVLICISLEQCIKRDRRLVAWSISGLIAIKYNKQPIKLLNFSSSTLAVPSPFVEFVFLIHWSGCWFAILFIKFLQDFLWIFLLIDEYFFFGLLDFHSQKKTHETKIGHLKNLHHILLEFFNLLCIASHH